MLKLKIMTILGTRPEIIRLSRVMALMDQYFDHKIVHTGQNYDYELNEIFFQDLDVRKPDYFLGVDTSSLGKELGNILISIETVFLKEKPDAVLILGDTNSAIAAIMAKRMKIPIYHMEAGNRCFDANVPEEINRKLVDHISDFNLVYTEHARRHLLSEGLHHRRIYLTGSPMKEVLSFYAKKIESSDVLSRLNLKSNSYFIVSMHREENVDSKKNLSLILDILDRVRTQFQMPIIVSTHPRTRARLKGLRSYSSPENINFLKPFGFLDYNKLQKESFCVISDSGTISEESSILSFPAITVRNAIERPEALDTGNIVMTGLNPDTVLNAISLVTNEVNSFRKHMVPMEYTVENVSQRVARLIIGTTKLSHLWDGISDNQV